LDGATPLHASCRGGFFECAKLLTDRGASIDAVDKAGQTPMSAAVVFAMSVPAAQRTQACLAMLAAASAPASAPKAPPASPRISDNEAALLSALSNRVSVSDASNRVQHLERTVAILRMQLAAANGEVPEGDSDALLSPRSRAQREADRRLGRHIGEVSHRKLPPPVGGDLSARSLPAPSSPGELRL
jgi:hypothetical protein